MVSKNRHLLLVMISLLWLALTSVTASHAQTFSEFFKQKKTQKKYLIKQIAALQLYLGYVKDGYRLVNSGLQTISAFTGGEFDLHKAFISSLTKVSPFVRNHTKVTEILVLQRSIGRLFDNLEQDEETLSPNEKVYIRKVRNEVSADGVNDLDELALIITSGKIEMTEDQRLKRLDKVYQSTRKRFEFTQQFVTDVNSLKEQKRLEIRSINRVRDIWKK